MSLAVIAPGRDRSQWIRYFNLADPSIKVEIWPEISDMEAVTCALVWKHPTGELLRYPNLRLICSMGAGVDHILKDPTLPPGVPITRVVDVQLTRDMSNYVIQGILNHQRKFLAHLRARERGQWAVDYRYPEKVVVGILGLGELGSDVARKLVQLDFEVHGYSQTSKSIEGVVSHHGAGGLKTFLSRVNALVCMLPLTEQTEDFLNYERLRQLQPGTLLINVARGEHLVEEDLIRAIEEGIISYALLDVFRKEPLPSDHPFWTYEQIMITPHNASVTDPKSVARQIAENYRRIGTGEPFAFEVDLSRGY